MNGITLPVETRIPRGQDVAARMMASGLEPDEARRAREIYMAQRNLANAQTALVRHMATHRTPRDPEAAVKLLHNLIKVTESTIALWNEPDRSKYTCVFVSNDPKRHWTYPGVAPGAREGDVYDLRFPSSTVGHVKPVRVRITSIDVHDDLQSKDIYCDEVAPATADTEDAH